MKLEASMEYVIVSKGCSYLKFHKNDEIIDKLIFAHLDVNKITNW